MGGCTGCPHLNDSAVKRDTSKAIRRDREKPDACIRICIARNAVFLPRGSNLATGGLYAPTMGLVLNRRRADATRPNRYRIRSKYFMFELGDGVPVKGSNQAASFSYANRFTITTYSGHRATINGWESGRHSACPTQVRFWEVPPITPEKRLLSADGAWPRVDRRALGQR